MSNILWFVSVEQINNNIDLRERQWQITIFWDSQVQYVLSFNDQVCLLMNIFKEAMRSAIFSQKSDRKKEKSMVSFTHEQNIICSQTQ